MTTDQMIYPEELTENLREVLGRPNFACASMAHLFRADGAQIPTRAEDEQAFVLHWMVKLVLKHGDGWREEAGKHLEEMMIRVETKT